MFKYLHSFKIIKFDLLAALKQIDLQTLKIRIVYLNSDNLSQLEIKWHFPLLVLYYCFFTACLTNDLVYLLYQKEKSLSRILVNILKHVRVKKNIQTYPQTYIQSCAIYSKKQLPKNEQNIKF